MIDIQIVPEEFQYDVQSMVQAFYMGHPFKINSQVQDYYRILKVVYEENRINIILSDNEKKLFEEHYEIDCSGIVNHCDLSKTHRTELKNVLKKLLYSVMSKDTGKELPWGNLTGIRPAKIPGMLFEQGMREEQVRKTMKETYLISDEKLNLAIDISRRESRILSDINYKEGYSLYVGIPFCPTTCLYCSFTSYPISMYKDKVDSYVDSVIKEIKFLGEQLKGRELNTVYIGGGTPTTLKPDQMDRLITSLKENFDFSTVREFTVEAGRPDSITEEKLKTLKKHNVSRISINPQTMNQKTLDLIGRKHTVEETKQAFSMAREAGHDNINMDLIVGLPGEDIEDVRHTMEELRKLDPDSITVHSLAVKRAARLKLFRDTYEEIGLKNSQEIMDLTYRYCVEQGVYPYYLYRQKNMAGNFENVGYAKVDKAGIYNILIMEEKQTILAAGAGASTKFVFASDHIERVENVKDVKQYIERIDEMIERKHSFMLKNGLM